MTNPAGLPYTPVVRAGDWVIVSGQIGLVDGDLVGGGFDAELARPWPTSRPGWPRTAPRWPTWSRRPCSSAT